MPSWKLEDEAAYRCGLAVRIVTRREHRQECVHIHLRDVVDVVDEADDLLRIRLFVQLRHPGQELGQDDVLILVTGRRPWLLVPLVDLAEEFDGRTQGERSILLRIARHELEQASPADDQDVVEDLRVGLLEGGPQRGLSFG